MTEEFMLRRFISAFLKYDIMLIAFMFALGVPIYLAHTFNPWFFLLIFVLPATVAGLSDVFSFMRKAIDESFNCDNIGLCNNEENDDKEEDKKL